MRTLYKTDSKGKTRVWYATTEDDVLIVYHGLEGGKIVEERTTCLPKNIGRANATTAVQQAVKELAALYEKKQSRDGYTETKGQNIAYIQPMLARDYSKVPHQLKEGPWYLSPKLDGVRAIWRPDLGKFQSRKGTLYDIPHLEKQLTACEFMLDGELYIHSKPLNQIVALTKKVRPESEQLEFQVFDIVMPGNFHDRWRTYMGICQHYGHPQIKHVSQFLTEQLLDIHTYHDQFVQDGYEGVMIRTNGPYVQGSRSPDLFKYKEFEEDEFEILDVKPDKRQQAVLVCDGFDVRMRGSDATREHQLKHPEQYVGKYVTVRYFALTEFGKPQFPVGVVIREDKP